MKLRIMSIALACTFLFSALCCASTHVNGYVRKDGTYVQPHYRSDPDSTVTNNWSYDGNVNPYTGEVGTKTYEEGKHHSKSDRTNNIPGYSDYTVPDMPQAVPDYSVPDYGLDDYTDDLDTSLPNMNIDMDDYADDDTSLNDSKVKPANHSPVVKSESKHTDKKPTKEPEAKPYWIFVLMALAIGYIIGNHKKK